MSDPTANINNPQPNFSSSAAKDEQSNTDASAKWNTKEFAAAVFDGVDFTGLIDPKNNPVTASKVITSLTFLSLEMTCKVIYLHRTHPSTSIRRGLITNKTNQDKIDVETFQKLAGHFGALFGYLSLDVEETNLANAEKAFWAVRECLVGYDEILKEFDSVYLWEGRPVSVLIEESSKVFRVAAKRADVLAKEMGMGDGEGEVSGVEGGSEDGTGDK